MENEKPQDSDEVDSIERLQEKLYSREEPSILDDERFRLKSQNISVQDKWKSKDESIQPKIQAKHRSLAKKVLFGAIIFFILALSVSAFLFFQGFNVVSSDNVDVHIEGPTTIEAGKELSLDISIENKNRIDLQDVSITLSYPDGTRDPENIRISLSRQEEFFGTIASRQKSESKTFESVILGDRNDVKEIKISVEYRPAGTEAIFTTEEVYEIGIRSSPVTLNVSAPKEVNSGQDAEFKISVISNSLTPIENLVLEIDYPPGFSLSKATPEAQAQNRIWILGDLEPREGKEITIIGVISGRENEEKNFNFSAGIQDEANEESIGIELVSTTESVTIKEPFINLSFKLNQSESSEYVAQIGSEIKGVINWQNALPMDLHDVSVEVRFSGQILDKETVDPQSDGFYQSQTNTIVWNKNTDSKFSRLEPKKSGSMEFDFKSIRPDSNLISMFKNNQIDLEIIMKGTRFSELRPPEVVSAVVKRAVKIKTDLSLAARAVYSIGPFNNTGPLPPKAETQTTYTIIWSVSNNFNNARDVVVTATLPIYVEWLGKFSPQGEAVTFDPETRTIAWKPGNIQAGTGYGISPKEVAFQVSLSPSLSQVGTSPTLINSPEIIGTDTFTQTTVKEKKPSISTRIATDPIFDIGKDKVVR